MLRLKWVVGIMKWEGEIASIDGVIYKKYKLLLQKISIIFV